MEIKTSIAATTFGTALYNSTSNFICYSVRDEEFKKYFPN